jgi:hypothetical protein
LFIAEVIVALANLAYRKAPERFVDRRNEPEMLSHSSAKNITNGWNECWVANYFLPVFFLFAACVSADAATDFTLFAVFGFERSFDALDATFGDVRSLRFAIFFDSFVLNALAVLMVGDHPHRSLYRYSPFRKLLPAPLRG